MLSNSGVAYQGKLDAQPLFTTDAKLAAQAHGPVRFEGRRSDVDDKYMGEKLPRRLARGPVQPRGFTDIFCCVIFALFFLGFVVIGIIFGIKGDTLNYDQLLDSESQACGIDPAVRNYPYLYMIKFSKNYRSVCVKECPRFDYNQIKYNSDLSNGSYIQPVYFENISSVIDYSVRGDIGNDDSGNTFDYDEGAAAGYYTRTQWNNYLHNFKLDCMPNNDVLTCKQNNTDGVYLYDSRQSFNGLCTPITPKAAAAVSLIGDVSGNWTRDIKIAKWMIFLSILIAFVLSVAFLWLSSWIMGFIIWLQLGIAMLFLIGLSIVLWVLAFGDHTDRLRSNHASAATIRVYQSLRRHRVVLSHPSGLCSSSL